MQVVGENDHLPLRGLFGWRFATFSRCMWSRDDTGSLNTIADLLSLVVNSARNAARAVHR
jgi:hypothetical protein